MHAASKNPEFVRSYKRSSQPSTSRRPWRLLLVAATAAITIIDTTGCSALNRVGPDVTCEDLNHGASNACQEGIIASCVGGAVAYEVCTESESDSSDDEICEQPWQRSGAYRCKKEEDPYYDDGSGYGYPGSGDSSGSGATGSGATGSGSTGSGAGSSGNTGLPNDVSLDCLWKVECSQVSSVEVALLDYSDDKRILATATTKNITSMDYEEARRTVSCKRGHKLCMAAKGPTGSQALWGAYESDYSLSNDPDSTSCITCSETSLCGWNLVCN